MKKAAVVILALVFAFVSTLALSNMLEKADFSDSQQAYNRICIVIDPGHGGRDAGTSAADGTAEKSINLSIALSLYDFLMVSGVESVMTRNGDYLVYAAGEKQDHSDLYNRMDFINSINNAVLVSIHQNFFDDISEWGMQIWYSANTPQSKTLADSILSFDKRYIQPDNKRVNKESDDSYYLLYRAKVPSVMVECGFMSNSAENEKLKQTDYQHNLSYCIMLGIHNYINEEL